MQDAPPPQDASALLRSWRDGDHAARDALFALFYPELRQAAAAMVRREPGLSMSTGDLTPSNIIVTHGGSAKLIDFGIARPPAPVSEAAASDSIAALSLTPGFAAPERQAGAAATTLTDIYSLGRLLDRMLGALCDDELRAIVGKATAADPAARYPTADALAADVARYRAGRTVAACKGGHGPDAADQPEGLSRQSLRGRAAPRRSGRPDLIIARMEVTPCPARISAPRH